MIWAAFCARIGRPDFIPLQHAGAEVQARLLADVRTIVATRTRAEWLRLFENADACFVPVNTVAEALADPHVAARRAVVRARGALLIRSPIRVATDPAVALEAPEPQPPGEPPALGADTDRILQQAGFDSGARVGLRSAGVIA